MPRLSRLLLWVPVLLMAALVAVQAAAPGPLEVRVLPHSVVTGAEFTLGEVAELDGADIAAVRRLATVSLGRAPLPGRSLRLSEGFVRARLAQAVDIEHVVLSVPAGAEVVRASQVVRGEDIGKRVLALAADQADAGDADVEQELAAPVSDAILPKGDVDWEIEPLGRHLSAGGSRTYRVVARVQDEDVYRTLVRVDQQVYRNVVVAQRPIGRNRIIRAADVRVERKPVVGLKRETYLTAAGDAVGKRAKRAIGEGEWVRPDLLLAVADVPEGSQVRLIYQTEQVRFTTPGVALVPAKVGQFIPVRNLQSGKIVYGVVQPDETVKVN